MKGNISVVDSVRNNWLKLQQKRLRLDIRKNFLSIVKYKDRLHKKVVQYLSTLLEAFKNWLNSYLPGTF